MIVTSVTGQAMLNMLPDYFAGEVSSAVIDTEGAQFDQLFDLLDFIIAQLFAGSASSWGLDRWESDLDLESYTGKPDDQRRSRIISKLRGAGTVTLRMIESVAESYVYGNVNVTVYPALYRFTIRFIDARGVPPNLVDLQDAIEDIKPAHLEVGYEFTYTTWGEVKSLTWGEVKDGGTWEQLKSRLIV